MSSFRRMSSFIKCNIDAKLNNITQHFPSNHDHGMRKLSQRTRIVSGPHAPSPSWWEWNAGMKWISINHWIAWHVVADVQPRVVSAFV